VPGKLKVMFSPHIFVKGNAGLSVLLSHYCVDCTIINAVILYSQKGSFFLHQNKKTARLDHLCRLLLFPQNGILILFLSVSQNSWSYLILKWNGLS